MIKGLSYVVTGEKRIHCEGCEHNIRHDLRSLEGIHEVLSSAEEQRIAVSINTDYVSAEQIEARLKALGYEVVRAPGAPKQQQSI
jgi:copper chaperone CopZ